MIDLDILRKAADIRRQNPVFCRECGRTDPPCGWHPNPGYNTFSLSTWLCWDCDRALRQAASK